MVTVEEIRNFLAEEARPLRTLLNDDMRVVTLKDVISNKLNEDFVLVGMLYRITHVRHDSQVVELTPYAKRQKVGHGSYNRIFQFGGTDGSVFCCIFKDEATARIASMTCKERIGIGQWFAFVEPKFDKGATLKTDQPVLECPEQMLTLNDRFVNVIPNRPAVPPQEAKEERFFFYHNYDVALAGVALRGKGDVYKPACGGYLCDRSGDFKMNSACGCFDIPTAGKISSVVLEYRVVLDLPELDGGINSERSWRTTMAFVDAPETLGLMQPFERIQKRTQLRRAIKNCCNYIKTHGKFTVAGTMMRGEIVDQSDTNSRVASGHPTYHLCYLMPSNLDLLDTPEFTRLKYRNVDEVTGMNAEGETADNALEIGEGNSELN